MEKDNSTIVPITIQPRFAYGIRTDVKGNIQFTAKQEVIYPLAGVLVIHDYTINKQKFLRFIENSTPEIIAISPNRKYLAVAEKFEKSWINIYDLSTLRRRKTLHFPSDVPTPESERISFTNDSKGVTVLTKEPDAFLIIFLFDKNETIVIGRVSNSSQKALSANYIACNPNDTGLIAVGGNYTLKLMARQEKGFSSAGTITGENKIVTSLTWISGDILIVGTTDCLLHFVENGDFKLVMEADTIEQIDLSKSKEDKEDDRPEPDAKKIKTDVNCLTNFGKGFAFSINNVVHVFQKESHYRYMKRTVTTIPITIYKEELYKIVNLAINPKTDTIIVTTLHSQIYIAKLFAPESLKVMHLEFKTLGEPLHINEINSMAVCSWKPIVMTSATDQTIRIWNYKTCKVELVKKFLVDITVVALHPSGMFVAVGFTDQMKLMQIFLDDLKLVQSFNFPKAKDAKFSFQGHMLAAAYGQTISIISVFSFDVLMTLVGHNGNINCIEWFANDQRIVSVGTDGAVYEWSILTGKRVNECIDKEKVYRSLQLGHDMSTIFVVTDCGVFREISNSNITREIKLPSQPELTSITVARSDMMMFIASEKGHLFNVQIPFLDAGGGTVTNFRFFQSPITTIKITYNDMLLATGTKDGTLVIWTIINNESRIAPSNPSLGQCTDVTIPRDELEEKNLSISSLQVRIGQQVEEFQFQIRQKDISYTEQINELHTNYRKEIDELKEKIERMELIHVDEINAVTESIAQINEEHTKAITEMETNSHAKLMIEYRKSTEIKAKMDDMREDYETKLRRSAGCLQDTVEALETDFKNQLQERQELIRELMKEMDCKKSEFTEYCRLVEIDNDRKLVEVQLQYENKLKEENDGMLKWRAEAGVLNKKLLVVSKNCDEVEKEKEILRNEHFQTQNIIKNHLEEIVELKRDIDERDGIIKDKEKRVNDLQKKNREFDKQKQALIHKCEELSGQIEPREREIKEKKEQISEMETELEGLERNNVHLELQLCELRDKNNGTDVELKVEKERSRNLRLQISRICGDIYHVSEYLQRPSELKDEVMKLYFKYADNEALKQTLKSHADVSAEFMRQRHHLETQLHRMKMKEKETGKIDQIEKLLKDNMQLLVQLNATKDELEHLQKKVANMESLLGLSERYLPASVARVKLAKACTNFDEMQRQHQEEIANLQNIISLLQRDSISK